MKSKIKRIFSIALIAIMLLLLFPEAAPVMAEDTPDGETFSGTPMNADEYAEDSSDTIDLRPTWESYDTTDYPNPPAILGYHVEKLYSPEGNDLRNMHAWEYPWKSKRYIVLEFENVDYGTEIVNTQLKIRWKRNKYVDDAWVYIDSGTYTIPKDPQGEKHQLKWPTKDKYITEDIPLNYDTPSEVNNVKVWFQAEGGSAAYTWLDCVNLQVTVEEPVKEPDLKITDVWNDDSTIYYKIKNVGNKKAGASSTSLTVDSDFKASDSVASLNPGVTRTESFTYSWNCTSTTDTIKVCADYQDDVDESSETNNCRTETWSCLQDLKITDVWNVGNTIYYKIKNVGIKKAEASNTSLTVDDVFKTFDSVASLEPEEERTESFNYTWNCTNTNDMIDVCADYMDELEEGSETNNCRQETWTCPPPDLVITDVWNDNSTIYYKIKNAGSKKAGTSNTSLTIDDVFKTSDFVASLEPGVERTESFNYIWNCTNTSDTIEVCADYTNDVTESIEVNNCLTETWLCKPPDIWVNLTSFDVILSPDVVSNYTLTIGNKGTGPLEFNIRDVEKGVASASVSSLDIASNNIIGSSDALRCEHKTASDNTEHSSNTSIVIDDEYIAKSQKSLPILLESMGVESEAFLIKHFLKVYTNQFWIINAIAAKVPAVKIEEIAEPPVEKIWLDRKIRPVDDAHRKAGESDYEENNYYERNMSSEENNQASDEYNQTLNETTIDITKPKWENQEQNASTIDVGASVLLYAHWSDDVGLSQAILSTNETGGRRNKTIYAFNSNSSWSNFTWHNASVPAGSVVGWRIYANDTSNNWNVTDIMTSTVEDMTPPMVIFVPPTPANNSEITVDYAFINVSVNENVSVALLNWNGTNITMNGSEKNFYLNITNLSNGNYTYSVYANDTAGNIGVSELRKVFVNVTTAPQDTTPPASISKLSHISVQTGINWTWSNPEDEDFEYAMVYINGTRQANTSECYYNATGLVPNASYEIGIRAVDASGNINEIWVNDTAFTLPLVFSVSITSPLDGQVFKQNGVIEFNCSVSDGTPPYSFNWTSGIDGFISDEESFSKSLSVGEHVVSLTVTDSSSQNETASVNISVIMGAKKEAKKGKIRSATTIIVPDDYPTIQQAVDNASDGNTIFVRSEIYHENIKIDNKDLTVEGEDRDTAIIDGGGSGDCVRVSSADVNISGFTIKNAGNYGVYAYSSDLNINKATIRNSGKDAIHFYSGKSLILRDSILENCGGGLIYDYYAKGNAAIERNIIRNNTGSGLYVYLYGSYGTRYEAAINENIIINNTEYGIKCDHYSSYYIDSIEMKNNTIEKCGNDGVFIEGAGDVNITNLTIEDAGDDGLYAECSHNMTMKNSTVKNSGDGGVYLSGPFTPILINNTIIDSGGYGIYLSISSTTKNPGKLINNVLTKNKYGFSITGTSIESYYQDIDTSNTINGKPIYYHVEEENEVFDNIRVGYLALISCKNIMAENLELTNNGQGVLMVNTSDSEIYFNNCSNNEDGIYLHSSDNNKICLNNFINNTDNVYSYKSTNIWNSTEPITYAYNNKTYTNYMGNYWDDYTDVDADNDGIWDNRCLIDYYYSDYDYHPLVGHVSDVAGWLSVSPKIDTINPGNQTNITVTFNTSGLDFGDYYANITITSNDPDEGVVIVPVHLNVGEVPNQLPVASFTYSPTNPIVNQPVIFNASSSFDPDPGGYIVKYMWDFGDENITNTTSEVIMHSYPLADDYTVNLTVTDNEGAINSTSKTIIVYPLTATLDTGCPENPYPSILGTHTGTIKPNQPIFVYKLYTYPCAGTGGHTGYVRIWNDTWDGKEAYWEGYLEDWRNITFDEPFTLFAEKTYYYEISTGSYPQIIHKPEHTTLEGSFINCTSFIDAHGNEHNDWILAFKLFL